MAEKHVMYSFSQDEKRELEYLLENKLTDLTKQPWPAVADTVTTLREILFTLKEDW